MTMKTKLYKILLCGILALSSTSCEDFLDVAPDAGLTEEKVFTRLANVNSYFSPVYDKLENGSNFWLGAWSQKWSLEQCTEDFESGGNRPSIRVRQGFFGYSNASLIIENAKTRPIFNEAFKAIRICNNVIANAHRITDAPSEDEINDILGQAYFCRGYAYFQLCRLWGGMPYLKDILTSDDDWDRPRLSPCETYQEVAKDMDEAYGYFKKAGRVRRDPKPGESGNLSTAYKITLPNGCAALALKSRALLYAASPLSNPTNDEQLWKDAAAASNQAIQVAVENGYELQPITKWLDNTYNMQYTNEQIWSISYGKNKALNNGKLYTYMTGMMMNNTTYASGLCPTQNFVDKYETLPINSNLAYPLNSEEDRYKAVAAGVFNPQDPYKNLDKRFYLSVFYNGAPLTTWKNTKYSYSIKQQINMWWEKTETGTRYSDHVNNTGFLGAAITGYMQRRMTGDLNYQDNTTKYLSDPIFMLSELYLNYAEAANEVGGPDYKVDGATMTSHEALVVIRNRAEQGEVRPEYLTSKDSFRARIKNERCIELAFTGHYYYDANRWKDAPNRIKSPIMTIDVEKLAAGYDKTLYPTGYKYTRVPLIENRQPTTWVDKMYYLPFTSDMYYQFKNFNVTLNEYW